MAYPPAIERILYTTNAVESLNSQLRRVLRANGQFPNDDAVLKILFLALEAWQAQMEACSHLEAGAPPLRHHV